MPAEHPLHRPRHGGRQRAALISAFVFFLAPMLALLLGARPAVFENRQLTSAPELSDGWGLFTGLPTWAADNLPFRDITVWTVDVLSRGVFGEPSPLGGQLNGGHVPGGPVAPVLPVVPSAPYASSSSGIPEVFPPVVVGEGGWLYFGIDVEAKCVPLQPLGQTVEAANRLRAAVEASGRQFILVVVPDKSTVESEFLPPDYPGRDCAQAGTHEFWSQITAGAGAVDLRSGLAELSSQVVPVYHQLDTHWTDRGALLLTTVLAERIEPGSTSTWKVAPAGTAESEADLPRLIGRTGSNTYEQYSLAPSGDMDRTGPHVGDLREPVRIGAGAVPGVVSEPVALLADSYSQSAARYLQAGFADVTLMSYGTAASDLARFGTFIAERPVVVLEVVERNLAAGAVPMLEPAALDAISAELAARPLR
ncbi:MAG: alginate O-acetyltransferase AlgX-related protein [Pseudonocardiales bacterium]